MDTKQYQEAQREAIQAKYGRKKRVVSKAAPLYPASSDREYQRICAAYAKIVETTMKAHLPAIGRIYRETQRNDARYDDFMDFAGRIRDEFQKIAAEIERRVSKYRLDKRIEGIAETTLKRNIGDWKRVVRKNFGINIFEDYYKGETYTQATKQWVADNVSKIKSIPTDSLSDMERVILDGFRDGRTLRDITKDIQNSFGVSKHKAQMLARDQISTLNSQLTQMQHKDAGVKRYKWSSSHDSRVRDSHQQFDGKIFSWDDPPEGWYMTKKGRKSTGRRCHPGEDYCCRCCAIPVFDLDDISLPVDPNMEKKKE